MSIQPGPEDAVSDATTIRPASLGNPVDPRASDAGTRRRDQRLSEENRARRRQDAAADRNSASGGLSWRIPLRHSLINTGVAALISLLALLPMITTLATSTFVAVAAVGVLGGSAIAWVAANLRWGPLRTAAVLVIFYLLASASVVFREEASLGFLPNLVTIRRSVTGAVTSWKQFLTLEAPILGFEVVVLVPYILGLLVSVLSVSVALRARRLIWSLVPLTVTFGVAVAFSAYETVHPLIMGVLFIGGALAWVSWGRSVKPERSVEVTRTSTPRRRIAAGAALIAGSAVVAITGGHLLTDPAGRHVARDALVPPLEMHQYPSPLTAFRGITEAGADEVMLTIEGLPPETPVRIAGLDSYDGIVYRVAGTGGPGVGYFNRVGEFVSPMDDDDTTHEITVTLAGHQGLWLPTVGQLGSIEFEGERATQLRGGHYHNRVSSTSVITEQLREGDSYTMRVSVPRVPTAAQLGADAVDYLELPSPAIVPPAISAVRDEIIGDSTLALDQIQAIEAFYRDGGTFSHGLEDEVPSRSGHSVDRLEELLTGVQMIGDHEQYAVAMSLALSELGIPSRVVMGYMSDEPRTGPIEITGEDVVAWVEVPFVEAGWVAFFPTPPEDNVPMQQAPVETQRPQDQLRQPPPPVDEPAELPAQPPVDNALAEDDLEEDEVVISRLWMIVGIVAGGILLVLLPGLILGLIKVRRRRRRRRQGRTVDQVSGGWYEVVDTAFDRGQRTKPGQTRPEDAAGLAQHYPEAGLPELATHADAAVWSEFEPHPEQVDQYWNRVGRARHEIIRSTSWRRRIVSFYSPASILRDWEKRLRRGIWSKQ